MVKEQRLLFGTTFKYFDKYDVALSKLTLIAFGFLLVSALPSLAYWVETTPWVWFLVAVVLFSIRPVMKAFKK